MNSLSIKNEKVLTEQRAFISRVYGWMALALLISGISAIFTVTNPYLTKFFFFSGTAIPTYVLIGVELILVIVLSAKVRTMSVKTAAIFFILYSIVDGMTLSVIFFIFELSSIASVFFISGAMFAIMTIYGRKTKQNLHSFGRYFSMALIGIIIASLVNLFLKSSQIDWIISLVAVVVFVGLTAYDTQKIMRASEYYDGSDVFKKAAIIGALELYLDFINIFLHLLSLFGKRRD